MKVFVVTLSCHEYIKDSGCMGVFSTFDAAMEHVLLNLEEVRMLHDLRRAEVIYKVRTGFWGDIQILSKSDVELQLCRKGKVFDEAGDRWTIREWQVGHGVWWAENRPPAGAPNFHEIAIQ